MIRRAEANRKYEMKFLRGNLSVFEKIEFEYSLDTRAVEWNLASAPLVAVVFTYSNMRDGSIFNVAFFKYAERSEITSRSINSQFHRASYIGNLFTQLPGSL